MSSGGPIVAIRNGVPAPAVTRLFDVSAIPPRLIAQDALTAAASPPRRTKMWEFSQHLHCSIIGTCLSTDELRQVLKKIGVITHGSTDHELHGIAVGLAGRRDDAGKQINKALDHRHKLAVSQFARATDEASLRAFWTAAVRRGEIPGAYWATLTHPASSQAIVREVFGQVHMLSHLVGSANRADIRRLCQLEADNAELEAKLVRQQDALQKAMAARDTQIKDLRRSLTEQVATAQLAALSEDNAVLRSQIAELERRLAAEAGRRASVEHKLTSTLAAFEQERLRRIDAELERDATRQELDAVEALLNPSEPADVKPDIRLDGIVLLYVGGRPNQVAPMRLMTERLGATFLHHDGGVENHPNLLPGLTSRSNIILFPVNCISHDAANMVKSLCRQAGKRLIPLRSASMTSLFTVLPKLEMPVTTNSAC